MCTNYRPSGRDLIDEMLGTSAPTIGDWPDDVYQDYLAPIVRGSAGGDRELLLASYGMKPRRKYKKGDKFYASMNARGETIGQKPYFAKYWREGQTCLLPTQWFYEPNYEANRDKAERWAIGMADESPFCIAGLWRQWDEDDGGQSFSFTQITVNADEHPLMNRFHKSGDEKRSVVIVPKSEYGAWLECRDPELARSMLQLYPAELMKAWPAAKGYARNAEQPSLF